MQIVKKVLPLVIFIVGGITGVFSQTFIQTNKSFYYWFIVPSFILGVYYAFILTSQYDKNRGGGVALGRIAITIFVTMVSYRAIQGYIIYLNCYAGKQFEKQVTGKVWSTNFPTPKQVFDKYSIVIILDGEEEKVTLDVPTDNYYVGQAFSKKMTVGSFGILYSSN